jgi:hypothetical protein
MKVCHLRDFAPSILKLGLFSSTFKQPCSLFL